jgi:hypothetical protein
LCPGVPGSLVGDLFVDPGGFPVTSVELVSAPAGLVELARRLLLRLHVALFRWRLDEEIAAGADPRARPDLALRAAQLVRPRYRRRLAGCVEKLVAEYDANRGWWLSAAVPFLRDQVGEARETLLAIASALRANGPVGPRGVAMLSKLLMDSGSPLYVRSANGALHLKAQAALRHLKGAGE